MSLDEVVEQVFDTRDLARVLANERGRHKTGQRLHALRMGNHVVLAAGRELPASGKTGIGIDDHHGCPRRGDRVPRSPAIGTVDIGQIRLEDPDAGYLHGITTMFPVCSFSMKAVCAA